MTAPDSTIAYIGRPGTGLGFRLAGIVSQDCVTGEDALRAAQKLTRDGHFTILFIDEELAADTLPELSKLNEGVLPAIVLLPTSSHSRHIAAASLQNLMIKAIGSDIFKT